MKKTIKYLQDGEYHYATVKDVGDLEQLKTQHKEDLVTALNELFTTGGDATPTGYDDLVKKVNDTKNTVDGISSEITDVNGKVLSHDEAIAQAKKDLQDALAQFQEFNAEIDQAKKDAETELANARQALKDEFNTNLADAQKANQKQLEDRVAAIQGNLDTTSNTLNDVKTQLTNAKLDYGAVNVSIQKLNDTLSTKLSSTDLDPLKTSIQQQETEIQQTKDTLSSKAGKAEFDVLTGRVSTAEANIKQQADEISLGVKKSELNGAIDNYQIEGTNRLRNTLDFDIDGGYWKLDQYSINSNTDVHPYDQAHDVSALVLQKAGSAKQDVDFTNEDLGQSFVISMWNKKDAQPQVWYGDTQLTNRQVAEIKGDYERSFFTFIPTNVNVKTLMFKYDAGTVDQLVIGEPKLELGTKPKAYAPNPNDEHKQIVNTKAELKIASDKIESAVEKQTKTDDNVNQLSSRVTQTEQGITATNDLITKTKDGLIKDYTGKIDASAKSLSSTFEEKTNEKIGQITDSGENLILNSAFTNESDRKDKWQNISDKVAIVDDGYGLMWAHLTQSGLTADNPISLTSNYFPIKQGKVTVGVDIKSNNPSGLSGVKILVLQTYNANKQRVDFTELSLEDMDLTISQLADGQSHRGVYRLGNDRSDAVYMTVKAILPRNGSIYFTNFSAKLSSIDNGGYTPNADDLKRQILNQKTQIEQNSQQITLKASSTELSDVRTIANGAVSSANDANNKINGIQVGGVNLLKNSAFCNETTDEAVKYWSHYNGSNGMSADKSRYILDNRGDTSVNSCDDLIQDVINISGDTDYTFSINLLKVSNSANGNRFMLYAVERTDTDSVTPYTDNGVMISSAGYHYHTFHTNPNTTVLRIFIRSLGGTCAEFNKVKLEKGNKATDWSPSPEDVDANTDTKISNLQIGGINLLKDTDKMTNTNYWGLRGSQSIRAVYGSLRANEAGVALSDYNVQGNNYIDYIPQVSFEQGTDYTVSFWTTIVDAPMLYLNANDNADHQHNNSQQNISLQASGRTYNGWKQVTATFKPKVATAYLTFAVSTAWVSSFKLEKGSKATDWQPAPEDTQSQIDQARTDIQSTLTVANNGITAATNLKTTYDNYVQKNDANIKLLGDRITNEVSKITSNGGGTNLLIISSFVGDSRTFASIFDAHWKCGNNTTWTFSSDKPVSSNDQSLQFTPKSNLWDINNGIWYIAPQVTAGEVYTFSFWGKSTSDGFKMAVESASDNKSTFVMSTSWKHYSGQLKFASDNRNMYFHANGANVGTVTIFHPMLEKGMVAHDWQPSPEDTQSQIEAVSSKIDQTATSITSTVNSTKQDLQGQINSANTKITQTANSITEQLKNYSKTGDMQNYVNTTIQKTADGITSKVSGVESRVNNLNISDRNLARGTSDNWTDYVFVTDGGANKTMRLSKVYIDGLEVGDVLTCGITIKNTGITAGTMRVQGSGDVTGWNDGSYYSPNYDIASAIPSGTTKELVYTITLTANMVKNSFWDANIRTDNVPKGGTLSYKCFFVKKGNINTTWSPAPEDVDTAIATTKNNLVQQITDAKNAAIKVSKDSIDSEVSDVRTTITQVNNKVSSIQANGGGQNLLQGTSTASGDVANGGGTFVKGAFNGYDAIKTNGAWSGRCMNLKSALGRTNAKAGDWYTISIYVKADKPINTGDLAVYRALGNGDANTNDGFLDGISLQTKPITTQWQQYSWTFQINDISLQRQSTRVEHNQDTPDNWIYWAGWMLEKGIVAHDWQPSPEDVATAISNVNTKVEQYKTGIDQTATGMNLFAQVITGNNNIDVTKSNIGIDPSQIKIASNKIVIDGDTSINGNVIAANNIKSGGTIEGVGLTIKNGDHVTTLDDRGFIDYKNSNKTVISDGTFMSNRVSLSGELQTSEKTTVNGATQYQTVSVGNGHLTFALYPFDPTPDIQINTSSSSTNTSSSSTSADNTDHPDLTFTSSGATAGQELDGVGGKISASYGLPNLQTGTNDMTGLEILGQNISLTARKVADTIDTSSIDKSIIDINNNAIKIGVLQNGGRGNASNIFIDNSGINLDTQWLTFDVTNMKVNGNAEFNNTYYTMFKPTGNQDALYVVSQKNSNSTQDYYAQTTLRAGSRYGNYGDSGLTFYWNSVKAFGTFDLRDTHVLGNRNTHFSVETTFDTDGEANMCFTWTSRSDLWNNTKIPMLARADWWTSQWGSCGLGFANGRLFYFTNDGHTYKQLN